MSVIKWEGFSAARIRRSIHVCLLLIISVIIVFCPGTGSALTAEEIMALKKAGVDDETIRIIGVKEDGGVVEITGEDGAAAVYYSTGRSAREDKKAAEREKLEQALRMLENIRIDTRP